MTTNLHSVGMEQDIDVYSQPRIPAGNTLDLQFQMRGQPLQIESPTGATFAAGWPVTEGPPMSIWAPAVAFQRSREPRPAWLADALRALAEVDDEIAEDGLPDVAPSARKEAGRIIVALARHPCPPTVYPTQDAEIAIHFKSPDAPSSVVILLDRHGRGECYAYTGGRSRRAHYDVASDLPDSFVMEQLRVLAPKRMTRPATQVGLGASALILAGVPTGL